MPRVLQRGFTLIEVLVVVVIVGIISAVVLLSTNLTDNDGGLRQESRRLASLIELSSDEAVLQGRDLGIEFMSGSYRFVEFDPYLSQWHEIIGDDLLTTRTLAEGLYFDLAIEDRRVQLKEQPSATGSDKEEDRERRNDREPSYAPHALIMSSGEITPFDLVIQRDRVRQHYTVTVTPAGNVEVADDSDDDS